jgi:hypothetical protein
VPSLDRFNNSSITSCGGGKRLFRTVSVIVSKYQIIIINIGRTIPIKLRDN